MKKGIFIKTRKLTATIAIAAGLLVASCNKSDNLFDLDINVDPNNPTQGSVALLLPQVQIDMANLMQGLGDVQMGMVGVISNSDSYGFGGNSFYGSWSYFYNGPGKDLDEIIKASKATGNTPYLGVAQAMKAWSFSTMVDLFGTMPFTEAFGGNAETPNINPKFDDGKFIYDECYKLLDSAILNLNAASPITIKGDIMYSGSKAAWIRFANTVRLRMLMTSRRVNTNASAQIQAALTATGGLISSNSQDFSWKYGGSVSPELRHPWYTAAYLATNNYTYIATQFMFDMLLRKDPRLPFYFRRQYSRILDQSDPTDRGATPLGYLVLSNTAWDKAVTAGVLQRNAADSAYLAGFFGRVRGDQSGVPNDVDYRLVPGVYPAAGYYDDRTKSPYILNTKANNGGAGVLPLITSVHVKFWKAEAELMYGFGSPKASAEAAVRESISTVVAFGLAKDANAKAPTDAEVNAYVNKFLADWDAAPSTEAKLNKLLYEAWFAGWGNGAEMYNALRRTGYPNNVLAPVILYSDFALRFPIPSTEATLNPNAPSPVPVYYSEPIFWDVVKLKYKN
ncbi:MAG: SusD/RagB family nutrient-binding outer membrane lipoprotein [Chitinophagaceae bacterium]